MVDSSYDTQQSHSKPRTVGGIICRLSEEFASEPTESRMSKLLETYETGNPAIDDVVRAYARDTLILRAKDTRSKNQAPK